MSGTSLRRLKARQHLRIVSEGYSLDSLAVNYTTKAKVRGDDLTEVDLLGQTGTVCWDKCWDSCIFSTSCSHSSKGISFFETLFPPQKCVTLGHLAMAFHSPSARATWSVVATWAACSSRSTRDPCQSWRSSRGRAQGLSFQDFSQQFSFLKLS